MRENPLAAEALPRNPLGSLQRSPDPLAGGMGLVYLTTLSVLRVSNLGSLPSQIRLPKSAYVVNWTYFTPPPLL